MKNIIFTISLLFAFSIGFSQEVIVPNAVTKTFDSHINSFKDCENLVWTQNENNYVALLLLCTHKGCDVRPAGSILACPCHGAEFSSDGRVLKGPATADLVKYKTRSDNENIYIYILNKEWL